MRSYETPYGKLNGIDFITRYSNGQIESCQVTERSDLRMPVGHVVPQYAPEARRRPSTDPFFLHPNGMPKAVALQQRTRLRTPLGDLPVELVTFYESGAVRRVFPLCGRLSGTWSWRDEYGLSEKLDLQTPVGRVEAHVVSVHFYETGALRSVALWPENSVTVFTESGEVITRGGLAFSRTGVLESFEPSNPMPFTTTLARIVAHDGGYGRPPGESMQWAAGSGG